jgi:hypothetical protein
MLLAKLLRVGRQIQLTIEADAPEGVPDGPLQPMTEIANALTFLPQRFEEDQKDRA